MWWALGLAIPVTAWLNNATLSASNWLNTSIFGSPNPGYTPKPGEPYYDRQRNKWVLPVAPTVVGTDWAGVIKLGLWVVGGLIALKAVREAKGIWKDLWS